jgi:RNA-binding protein
MEEETLIELFKHNIDKKKFYELKARSKALEPVVRVGKNGVNDNVILNIMQLLKKYRLIKIKVLKNALGDEAIDSIIVQIKKGCDALVIDKVGLIFVLYKGNK